MPVSLSECHCMNNFLNNRVLNRVIFKYGVLQQDGHRHRSSMNEFYNPHLTAAPRLDTAKFGTLAYSLLPLQELNKNLYFHQVPSESSTLVTRQGGEGR